MLLSEPPTGQTSGDVRNTPALAATPTAELLAALNHDIRTSMNGIVGMIDLLLDTGLSDLQQEYARLAQQSADMLLDKLECTLGPAHRGSGQTAATGVHDGWRPQAVGTLENGEVSPFPPTGLPPAALIGRHILVADDNPVNLRVAAYMLERFGCHVEFASNGQQAVEKHAAAPCDLVLMDCDMPHMDGFQATARIRALEGPAGRTPVVALTALTNKEEREKCLSAGMDDYLSKPVRPQVLCDTLLRWLAPAEQTAHPGDTVALDELEATRDMFGTAFAELAALYRNDAPPRLQAMQDAWQAGDLPQLARIAHAFAGSSASIGASALSGLCKDLEAAAKSGTLANFNERHAAIVAEYERINARLNAMLEH